MSAHHTTITTHLLTVTLLASAAIKLSPSLRQHESMTSTKNTALLRPGAIPSSPDLPIIGERNDHTARSTPAARIP